MNRRNFLKNLAAAAASFAILPAATTYHRAKWVKNRSEVWIVNPEWVEARYEVAYYMHLSGGTAPYIGMPQRFTLDDVIWKEVLPFKRQA